jgi:hypothetical protein
MIKKIFINLVILSFIVAPLFVLAQEPDLVPDCGWAAEDGTITRHCTFADFFLFADDILKFLIFKIALPLAVLLVLYAGFLYLTTGISGQKAKATKILWAVVWGFVIMLGAWLFINFILEFFLKEDFRKIPDLAS